MVRTYCDRCEREIDFLLTSRGRELLNMKAYDIGHVSAVIGEGDKFIVCECCRNELKNALKGYFHAKTL